MIDCENLERDLEDSGFVVVKQREDTSLSPRLVGALRPVKEG